MSAKGSFDRGGADPRGTNLVPVAVLVGAVEEYANGSKAGSAALAAAGEALVKAGNVDAIDGCVVLDVEDAKEAKGSTRFPCPVCDCVKGHNLICFNLSKNFGAATSQGVCH